MLRKQLVLLILILTALFFNLLLCAIEEQRAIVIGDSRTNIEKYREVTEKIVLQNPKVVFHTGDMVANGLNKEQWEEFDEATLKIKKIAAFYPACGNHEVNEPAFMEHFPDLGTQSWYATDQIGLHWIVLNSQISLAKKSKQFIWLEKELKRSAKKFNIIVLHHPIYSSGQHAHELDSKNLRFLIEKYKVKLVFSGHDHLYERSFHEGTNYIVTGGAGAPLKKKVYENPYSQLFFSTYHYCVIENNLSHVQMDVYDLQDNKIDSLTIQK